MQAGSATAWHSMTHTAHTHHFLPPSPTGPARPCMHARVLDRSQPQHRHDRVDPALTVPSCEALLRCRTVGCCCWQATARLTLCAAGSRGGQATSSCHVPCACCCLTGVFFCLFFLYRAHIYWLLLLASHSWAHSLCCWLKGGPSHWLVLCALCTLLPHRCVISALFLI